MKLFEIRNGYHGESYVRVYAWAETKEEAIALAQKSFTESKAYPLDSRLEIKELLDQSTGRFVSLPSDSGFEL